MIFKFYCVSIQLTITFPYNKGRQTNKPLDIAHAHERCCVLDDSTSSESDLEICPSGK